MPFPFASPDRLLARFQRTGDAKVLGALFDRTAPELLRIAAWLCGNRTDAEDLLQRTFLTVLTKQGGYDATRRAMPWLCGILGNHCKKLHEQRQLRAATTTWMPVPAANADPVRDAADAEFAVTVARVRAELGSPYAEVLDLHLAEGLDAKRIAERLGRPAGTVRTQIVRGLALLRRHLPSGFVAGLVLSASVQAASLAAVRAVVMAEATATTTVAVGSATAAGSGAAMTFGGMLMANKIVWLAPGLLLLLGGGAFWWQQRTAEAVTPAAPTRAVTSTLPASLAPAPPTATTNPPTERTERQAAEQPDQPVAEAGFATLVVHMRWADDHTPAANVGVLAKPQPNSPLTERGGLTDAHGTLVLHRLRPGACSLTSAFTKSQSLDLTAASVTTIELDAARTGTIAGTVVDDQQRPVADARLWTSIGGNPFRGFEVGCSDAQGRFRLPFVEGQDLGARKTGYAPSLLLELNWGHADVTLTLAGAGGTVQGRVVDGDNRAIAEAYLEIGSPGGSSAPGSTMAERWKQPTAPKLTTAVDGSFVHEGVAAGTTELKAWAPGFGPITETVVVDAGRTTTVALVLPRGAVVEGTVRDAAGHAVAGATVARVGNLNDFARPRTTSGDDGSYRLVDLPAGSVELSAVTRHGKVAATVATSAGATTIWDPVAASSPSLVGRVVGPDGKPLSTVQVGVVPAGQHLANPQTTTDENGAFELRDVRAGATTLVVELDLALLATREVLVPAAEPVVVTLTPNELPTAHVRGRVVDTAGKPLAAFLTIRLPTWRWCPATAADANGVFHRGPVSAGDYLVSIEAKGHGTTNLGVVHVDPGEDKTLPDVVLARAGRVELELRGGEPAPSGTLQIARDDGALVIAMRSDGHRAAADLPPGTYLAIMHAGTTRAATTFTVRSEQTTTAVLVFAPAFAVTFTCALGQTPSPNDLLQLVVRDAAGAIVDCTLLHLGIEPPTWQTLLPSGPYSVTARTHDGHAASTPCRVRASREAQTIEIATPQR